MYFFQVKKILCKLSKYDISGSVDIREKIFHSYIWVHSSIICVLMFSPLFIETERENIGIAIALSLF